jgi:hypothetical protein
MNIYDERQVIKRRMEQYREFVRSKGYTGIGNVAPMNDGAFVEVTIWVPLSAIEPPKKEDTK